MSKKTLLFIIADRPSQLAAKGEITRRYYNPGDHFDHVHILTTTNDRIDPQVIAATAGRAELTVHSLWNGSDRANMLFSPVLHRRWGKKAVALAQRVGVDVVRTGDRLTGYLGSLIKEELGVPHILSLHTHRDDSIAHMPWGMHRLFMEYEKRYARRAIAAADAVVIVYESLRDHAQAYGARRIERIYNVISPELRAAKQDYSLHGMGRMITVGRQLSRKLPDQIIRAMAGVNAELTVVGDGDAHQYLEHVSQEAQVAERVNFEKSLPNRDLCRRMVDFDGFVAHTQYPEFPKTIMEALWLGVPVIVNDCQSRAVPEMAGDWLLRVANSPEGYGEAMRMILGDEELRRDLGVLGRRYAEETFDPSRAEAQAAELYAEFS